LDLVKKKEKGAHVVLYPYKRKYENPRVIYPSYINFIIVQRKQILKVLFFNRCKEEEWEKLTLKDWSSILFYWSQGNKYESFLFRKGFELIKVFFYMKGL